MAQSVEHVIGNDEVISSILITSSTKNGCKRNRFLFCKSDAAETFPNRGISRRAVAYGSVGGCCSPMACATRLKFCWIVLTE